MNKEQLKSIPPVCLIGLMIFVLFQPLSNGLLSTIAIVFLTAMLLCSLDKGTFMYRVFTFDAIIFIVVLQLILFIFVDFLIIYLGFCTILVKLRLLGMRFLFLV